MQLHQLRPTTKKKYRKRVGRGGKRGTYSGHGSKGQKSRAGARIRPGFRGGDNPIWKLFPKQRGATKKVDIKQRRFRVKHPKPAVVNLGTLEKNFQTGETVSAESLLEKGLITDTKNGVKILGDGALSQKLVFTKDLMFSKSAREKMAKVDSAINE